MISLRVDIPNARELSPPCHPIIILADEVCGCAQEWRAQGRAGLLVTISAVCAFLKVNPPRSGTSPRGCLLSATADANGAVANHDGRCWYRVQTRPRRLETRGCAPTRRGGARLRSTALGGSAHCWCPERALVRRERVPRGFPPRCPRRLDPC